MKRVFRSIIHHFTLASLLVGAAACAADPDSVDLEEDAEANAKFEIIEQKVLDKWIADRADSLVDNRQNEGYYIYNIDVVNGSSSDIASNAGECWVRYNITNRDLEGNVSLTRNEGIALVQGKFSFYTHYAPLKRQVLSSSREAIDLALLNQSLVIDGVATQFYAGSKFAIIMPSHLAGANYNGTGGYAGQFELDTDRPIISEIEIIEVMPKVEIYESTAVDGFTVANGSFNWRVLYDSDDVATQEILNGLYLCDDYTPTALNYVEQYNYGATHDVDSPSEFNDSIAQILIDRFGAGVTSGDKVTKSESCKVWYIARTLDGFIIDSNIEEVRALAFDDHVNSTLAIDYQADTDNGTNVDMWRHTIPELKYGQWAVIVGTSEFGYGTANREDSGSASEVQGYMPIMFEIYIEPIDYD